MNDKLRSALPFVAFTVVCVVVGWLLLLKSPMAQRSKLQATISAPLPRADGDVTLVPDSETKQSVKLSIPKKGSARETKQLIERSAAGNKITLSKTDVVNIKGSITGSLILSGTLKQITQFVADLRKDIVLLDNGQIRGDSPLIVIQKFQAVPEAGGYKAVIDFSQANNPNQVLENLPGGTKLPDGAEAPEVTVPDTTKQTTPTATTP